MKILSFWPMSETCLGGHYFHGNILVMYRVSHCPGASRVCYSWCTCPDRITRPTAFTDESQTAGLVHLVVNMYVIAQEINFFTTIGTYKGYTTYKYCRNRETMQHHYTRCPTFFLYKKSIVRNKLRQLYWHNLHVMEYFLKHNFFKSCHFVTANLCMQMLYQLRIEYYMLDLSTAATASDIVTHVTHWYNCLIMHLIKHLIKHFNIVSLIIPAAALLHCLCRFKATLSRCRCVNITVSLLC